MRYKIVTFYEFKRMAEIGDLKAICDSVRALMRELRIVGTVIIADEGYNSTAAGEPGGIDEFIERLCKTFHTEIVCKASFSDELPFRRIDVKVKPEIVTLKRSVDIDLGKGTHVKPEDWNELIASEDVLLLDTRNDYEFRTGTFERAVNPETKKFSELPKFVERELDPAVNRRVAMFCTGGIRCEKFAPFMKSLGFEEVYQLEGGILKYLEVVPPEKQKWRGECFVFDGRVSVDGRLRKGESPDLSRTSEKEE
jgi:UPF0176 protein